MPLPPLATVEEFAEWPGVTVADAQRPQAAALLRAASSLVRVRGGRNYVDEDGNLVADIPDAVGQVVVMTAARVWLNPVGARTRSETIDGYSDSVEFWEGAGLTITDDELAMLPDATAPLSSVKIYSSVPPRRPRWWEDDCG